jgi:hypothetical protein
MEAKVLNFIDAMKLAEIVSQYIEVDSINMEETILQFIDNFINKVAPMDYLRCIKLLYGKELQPESLPNGNELITILSDGITKNNLLSLLKVRKELGFSNE